MRFGAGRMEGKPDGPGFLDASNTAGAVPVDGDGREAVARLKARVNSTRIARASR
jgi:hypothetical protein